MPQVVNTVIMYYTLDTMGVIKYSTEGKSDNIEIKGLEPNSLRIIHNNYWDHYSFVDKKLTIYQRRHSKYQSIMCDLNFIPENFERSIVVSTPDCSLVFILAEVQSEGDDRMDFMAKHPPFYLIKVDLIRNEVKYLGLEKEYQHSGNYDFLCLKDRIFVYFVVDGYTFDYETHQFLLTYDFDLNFLKGIISPALDVNVPNIFPELESYDLPILEKWETDYDREMIIGLQYEDDDYIVIFDRDLNLLKYIPSFHPSGAVRYPDFILIYEYDYDIEGKIVKADSLAYRNDQLVVENFDVNKIPKPVSSYDYIDGDPDYIDPKYSGIYYTILSEDEIETLRATFQIYSLYRSGLVTRDFILNSIDLLPYNQRIKKLIRSTIFSIRVDGSFINKKIEEAFNTFIKDYYNDLLSNR